MSLSGRDDNRMYVFQCADTTDITEVNLQATGREPMILRIETATCYVSYDKNNWLLLEDGLYQYELGHPFGGQFFIKKGSGLAKLTFMVGGAI